MNKKRYAIVRLSEHFCEAQQICNEGNPVCSCEKNEPCRYGDTKEQLIAKVRQALEICKNKGYRNITSEEYAKFIVEFLGVE